MAKLYPFKVAAKVASWPILSRILAILATFFDIWTSNLFCPSFTSILRGDPSYPSWKSIGPKLTILASKKLKNGHISKSHLALVASLLLHFSTNFLVDFWLRSPKKISTKSKNSRLFLDFGLKNPTWLIFAKSIFTSILKVQKISWKNVGVGFLVIDTGKWDFEIWPFCVFGSLNGQFGSNWLSTCYRPLIISTKMTVKKSGQDATLAPTLNGHNSAIIIRFLRSTTPKWWARRDESNVA